MTLRSWLAAHPESTVLQPDPGFAQEYKDFAGYDRRRPATPADLDAIPMWGRRTWVLGVTVGSTAKAFLWDDLVSRRVTSESVGDVPIVIVIEKDGAGLRMRFAKTPELTGRLEHWQHDSFIVRWDQRWLNADAFVDFDLDHDGAIRGVRMEPVSPLTDFSFDFQDLRLAPVPKS